MEKHCIKSELENILKIAAEKRNAGYKQSLHNSSSCMATINNDQSMVTSLVLDEVLEKVQALSVLIPPHCEKKPINNNEILTIILRNQVEMMKALFSHDFKQSLKMQIEYARTLLDNFEKENA